MRAHESRLPNGRLIVVVQGDITRIAADAIVNAANAALVGGGGVDGAIHRAGGPEIMRHLDEIRPVIGSLSPGQAIATTAGRLPAKFVFHTAGPIYHDGAQNEPWHLACCYRTCLDMAVQHELRSISFPAISTGIFGYPKDQAAAIAIREVVERLSRDPGSIEKALFVQFTEEDYDLYVQRLPA